jgi:hypothetical protein
MDAGQQEPPPCCPADIIPSLVYKPGWQFKYDERRSGSRLCIRAVTVDSNQRTTTRATGHAFALPPPMPYRDFVRWAFYCCLLCELHEAGEFFEANGLKPFYPNHQDEGSPYELVERWEPLCP